MRSVALVLLLKVLPRPLNIRPHPLLSRLPPHGANLPVLVSEPERFHQPQRLLHRPPNRHVVDGDLPQNPFMVDDEQPPERNPLPLCGEPRTSC